MNTKRLNIRLPKEKDVNEILKICNSEYVLKYNAMPAQNCETMLKSIIKAACDSSAFYLELKQTNQLIGAIFIEQDNLRYNANSICLSYYLNEEYASKGYMSEALQRVMEYLFKDKKYDIVSARAFAHNKASIALLKKLGFVQEGYLRHCVCGYGNVVHDDIVFSILKSEFCAKENML